MKGEGSVLLFNINISAEDFLKCCVFMQTNYKEYTNIHLRLAVTNYALSWLPHRSLSAGALFEDLQDSPSRLSRRTDSDANKPEAAVQK